MAMHLTFRKERCKGCGLCITVCPKQILALEDGTNIKGYRPAHCTARICPDSIITIEKD